MQNITIPYNEETLALAREIIRDVRPYTPEQLAEIPAILATKARYFWANDLNDWEVFKDVYTDEAPEGFRVSMGAGEKHLTPDEQVASISGRSGRRRTWSPCTSVTTKSFSS